MTKKNITDTHLDNMSYVFLIMQSITSVSC